MWLFASFHFKHRVHELVTRFFRVHHNENGWRALTYSIINEENFVEIGKLSMLCCTVHSIKLAFSVEKFFYFKSNILIQLQNLIGIVCFFPYLEAKFLSSDYTKISKLKGSLKRVYTSGLPLITINFVHSFMRMYQALASAPVYCVLPHKHRAIILGSLSKSFLKQGH